MKKYIYSLFGGENRLRQEQPLIHQAVKDALEAAGFKPEFGEVTMKPEGENVFAGEDGVKMQKLLDALENLDDVQEIYTTAVIDE